MSLARCCPFLVDEGEASARRRGTFLSSCHLSRRASQRSGPWSGEHRPLHTTAFWTLKAWCPSLPPPRLLCHIPC